MTCKVVKDRPPFPSCCPWLRLRRNCEREQTRADVSQRTRQSITGYQEVASHVFVVLFLTVAARPEFPPSTGQKESQPTQQTSRTLAPQTTQHDFFLNRLKVQDPQAEKSFSLPLCHAWRTQLFEASWHARFSRTTSVLNCPKHAVFPGRPPSDAVSLRNAVKAVAGTRGNTAEAQDCFQPPVFHFF